MVKTKAGQKNGGRGEGREQNITVLTQVASFQALNRTWPMSGYAEFWSIYVSFPPKDKGLGLLSYTDVTLLTVVELLLIYTVITERRTEFKIFLAFY